MVGASGGKREKLTGVVGERARQAEPEELPEGDGLKDGVGTPVEVANAVESFDRQGQAGEQPHQEKAVGLMVADVFEAVAVFGVVEPLILDFPATLGHAEDDPAADFVAREVGEPVGLAQGAVGLVLPITNHPHRFPTELSWACRPPEEMKISGVPPVGARHGVPLQMISVG